MNSSWIHTRESLKKFTKILVCGKCGKKPNHPTRYTNCGHFFCTQCIDVDSKCSICRVPVQPNEIQADHTVANLIRYCDIIADIVKEKDLWSINKNTSNISNVLNNTLDSKLFKNIAQEQSNYVPKIVPKNINKRNPKGETLLHTACIKRQAKYVKMLLDAGATPNTKDNANWSPLQEAVNLGYYEICKILLEAGASPNIPGIENKTALHEAAINNRLNEAKLLLRYQGNKEVYDEYGKRPIDYSCSKEMQSILSETNECSNDNEDTDLNFTLDPSSSETARLIIYASNLKNENKMLISKLVSKHKIKVMNTYTSSVSHVIIETNDQNVTNLTYDIMLAILHGKWLLNSEWIALGLELDDIFQIDIELFEVSGAPVIGIPKKARENVEKQNPRLFNKCFFYLALQAKSIYHVGNIELTKEKITKLIIEGDGKVLAREPDPENSKDIGQFIPFHTAHNLNHPLHKCTHYIIYFPGKDEPRIKYNMEHVKSLPLVWLLECIEKFTLVDPTDLGLL